ncbi:response regulator transcription factor [Nocardioides sp. LHG3406-4]|uniref:response regulator transcription factor n=1 Tax=Nocardioides sp. LHG3406-4 TaxID=2804575 RepID=UPI003CF2D0F2
MLRVAIVDDFPVVVSGLRTLLEPYADRVVVASLRCGDAVGPDFDMVLYDARLSTAAPLRQVVEASRVPVVLYTWEFSARQANESLAAGVQGCLSKSLDAADLVTALEKVAGGSVVVSPDPCADAAGRPTHEHSLSARELEVILLVADGLSNQEIAERSYVSVNTVRTYIRSAYRKMGVERRTQAVRWVTEHGLEPR